MIRAKTREFVQLRGATRRHRRMAAALDEDDVVQGLMKRSMEGEDRDGDVAIEMASLPPRWYLFSMSSIGLKWLG